MDINSNTTNDEQQEASESQLNVSGRSDILDEAETISPDLIYEQRMKMEEKFQRESEEGMSHQILQPIKKGSLQPPTAPQEEQAHQASVQDYVNQRLQARAQALNIDLDDQRASITSKETEEPPKGQREPSISFPSSLDELEHPPNLPMYEDSEQFVISDRSNLFDMSEHSAITPAMIAEQRAKFQAKSGRPSGGSSVIPGAVRIGREHAGDIEAPKGMKKVSSLPSVGEHLAGTPVEAQLVNEDQNSELFKARLEEETEAYRSQVRSEIMEQEKKKSENIVYATATKDDTNCASVIRHHKLKILTFLLLLTGGIVAAVLFAFPSNESTSAEELPLVYDPPTAEECAAISQGETLSGQQNMTVELLDVEVDVSLDSEDVDIATLLPSLEAAMKERLVPALSECPFEPSTSRKLRGSGRDLGSDNPKYVIANTILQLQKRPGVSCSEASEQPCHRIVMQLELFLKGPEYVSTLMNMIYDAGEIRPVVTTLGLQSPYKEIRFVAINSGTPADPTVAPTELALVYDPPSPQDCEDISLGLNLPGQEDMVVELLDVEVDVSLDNSTEADIVTLLPSLEQVMKERLVRALSHCPFEGADNRRSLGSESSMYVVANTFLQLQDRPGAACSERSPKPCHRIVMKLELFLKGHEYVATLMNLVYDLRKDRPVVETLGLGSPYASIDFVAINAGTPTDSGNTSIETQSNGDV